MTLADGKDMIGVSDSSVAGGEELPVPGGREVGRIVGEAFTNGLGRRCDPGWQRFSGVGGIERPHGVPQIKGSAWL